VPAAAVIPAPIAYIKVVAVKKLVVGSRFRGDGTPCGVTVSADDSAGLFMVLLTECHWMASTFTLKKLECSKQALQPEH
jgi:hypothetical protein